MKKIVPLILCLLAGAPVLVNAASALTEAAILAAHRDSEERFRRLEADIQNIQDTQQVLLKRQEEFRQRLDRLAQEIRDFKDDQGRSTGKYATREEVRSFVDKLKELDDKREADKKLILNGLQQLAKAPPVPAAVEPRTPPPAARDSEEAPYLYTVKRNDRLLDIIAGYNEHFQKQGMAKITLNQVLRVNPGLKADRLMVGKQIRIPVPPKQAR